MPYDRRDSKKSISSGGDNVDLDISNGMMEDIGLPILSDPRITDSRRDSGLPNFNGKQDTDQPISHNGRDSDLLASNDRRKSSQTMSKERESIFQSISNSRKNSQPSSNGIDQYNGKRDSGLPISNDKTHQTNSRQSPPLSIPYNHAIDTIKCALRNHQKAVCHSPRNALYV